MDGLKKMPKSKACHPLLTMMCLLSMLASLDAQSITVGIQEFADLGINARMSVMTADPSGRLFVNDQRGGLYHVERSTRAATLYLDLSDDSTYPSLELVSGSEPGFQSFAFHPDFATSAAAGFGKFYTMHSSDNNSPTPDFDPGGSNVFHSVLLEWNTSDPTSTTFVAANPAAPFREVARFQQPFSNHNAGLIAFNSSVGIGNPDRNNLYVAIGDGGSGNDPQNNGQDSGNPFGAILRINPLGNNSANGQYGIVGDNVFAADGNSNTLAEIFAWGLRNPQRFGWDSSNGDMYIADIGQNSFEEINLAQNGGNFGWDQREGSAGTTPAGFIDPVADYSHSGFMTNPTAGGSLAITVGEVYRGSLISELEGQLLLGDFPNGAIYTLDVDNDPLNGGQDSLHELILVDMVSGQQGRLSQLIAQNRVDLRFSYGIDGEVFILNKRDGIVRHLVTLSIELGDCNLDGIVNFLDISSFIAILTSSSFLNEADCNRDNAVNFLDIGPFIEILSNN